MPQRHYTCGGRTIPPSNALSGLIANGGITFPNTTRAIYQVVFFIKVRYWFENVCVFYPQTSRIEKLYRVAADYLRSVVPQGYYVGIVVFDYLGKTVANLTKLNSETEREELVSTLPRNPDGGTGIGSGLLQGVKVILTIVRQPNAIFPPNPTISDIVFSLLIIHHR